MIDGVRGSRSFAEKEGNKKGHEEEEEEGEEEEREGTVPHTTREMSAFGVRGF